MKNKNTASNQKEKRARNERESFNLFRKCKKKWFILSTQKRIKARIENK
jgi:hypothetical protein